MAETPYSQRAHRSMIAYTDLAVLDEPENVLETVIVQKNGLQDGPVRTLQDLRDGI